ncbi:MAG: hypothetical protein WAV46_04900 [Candidatus Moraniibacteriota bacterium]
MSQTRQNNREKGENSVKDLPLAEDIIRRAEEALERGDMAAAVTARKALVCTIRMGSCGDSAHLAQKHAEIYAGIGKLIKTRLLS